MGANLHAWDVTDMVIELPTGKTLRLIIGDITKIRVDAMVNAANSQLRGGGGVDGAIHRAAGPSLMHELNQIRAQVGSCPTGSAVVTSAGALPAQYVFHAVGPVYRDGQQGEPEQLADCYRKSLALAEERDVRSLSFPAISTGAYGYPAQEASRIAIRTVLDHLRRPDTGVREVIFVLWDQGSYETHVSAVSSAAAS